MRLFSICGPTGSAETVTVVVVTLRPGIGARPVVTDRLASRDRPTPTPAQALELCTHVGQAHGRWSCTARGSPTPVPISNACTQLSRLWASARTGADVEARRPPRRRRWSHARTLDKRTSVGVARPADLQRPYRSPTRVPNSHACGQTPRPAVALSHAIAPFQSTPRDQHFTHHMPLRLSRCPRAEQAGSPASDSAPSSAVTCQDRGRSDYRRTNSGVQPRHRCQATISSRQRTIDRSVSDAT
jgi:hypothetical protein